MTRKELIEKTEQLCELYVELNKEGIFGILHYRGETRIQCKNHTFVKFAENNPTRKRTNGDYTETNIKLDKFTAFTLNEVAQNDEG